MTLFALGFLSGAVVAWFVVVVLDHYGSYQLEDCARELPSRSAGNSVGVERAADSRHPDPTIGRDQADAIRRRQLDAIQHDFSRPAVKGWRRTH